MERVMDVIRAVRNIRTEMNVPPAAEVECVCISKDPRLRQTVEGGAEYIRQLARVRTLRVIESGARPSHAVSSIMASGEGGAMAEVFVPLKGLIDFEVEIKRLTRELDKTEKECASVGRKLSNEEFLSKAPEEVIEKERQRLEAAREKLANISTGLERIRSISG
jgi:valyl-tRNA synthetase